MSGTNEGGQVVSSLRRSAPLLALMLLLLAGWFAWNGYTQWRHEDVTGAVERARESALAEVGRALVTQAGQYDKLLKDEQVVAALASGDATTAAAAIRERFKGAEDVQVWPANLADAYADSAHFGYSRLALLEAALQNDKAQVRIVRDGGQPRLGIAARVQLGDTPAVTLVRLPLLRLTGAFDALDIPADGYLALRQGAFNVVQKGDTGLAGSAEAMSRPLGKDGMRVAAAVREVDAGPFGLGAIPCIVVAVLMVALALLALLARFRGDRGTQGELIRFNGSGWLLTLAVYPQPFFIDQPENISVWWGYGLAHDRPGDLVRKPMRECSGAEILEEVLFQLQSPERERENILAASNCIPCTMPYVTSPFMARDAGDRPPPLPAGSRNLAFLGQYVELADETALTIEYSVRSAQAAVYALMAVDRPLPPVRVDADPPDAMVERLVNAAQWSPS